jgi:hypothetical protein
MRFNFLKSMTIRDATEWLAFSVNGESHAGAVV